MSLVIVWNDETSEWEVRHESDGELQWSGKLRRVAVFYARDREDDPNDDVDKVVAYNRDGSVAWGS